MKNIQWNLEESSYRNYIGNTKGTLADERATEKQMKNGSIYAGKVKVVEKISAVGVKEKAQKRALKKLVDQMKNDIKDDDILTQYKEIQTKASEDILERQKQIEDLENAIGEVMNGNNMTEEDIDRKNSWLVRKSLTQPEKLTAEDKKQLAAMPAVQRDILTFKAMQDIHKSEIANDQERKKVVGQATEEFKIELLKGHLMVDAQKEADAIMEEASQTAFKMLIEEGKDKIDTDMEESKEIQEKKAEEKKEQEKRTEKDCSEIEQLEMRDFIENLQNVAEKHEKIQREVEMIMKKELLIDDDLKGLNMDELL